MKIKNDYKLHTKIFIICMLYEFICMRTHIHTDVCIYNSMYVYLLHLIL